MPVFQIDVEKSFGSAFWTNRYFVTAASIENAHEGAAIILDREVQFHREDIVFTKYRTRTVTEGDDVFIITPVSVSGAQAPSGPYLPLFNVARVDISVAGFGRPSRKFYRIGLCAGDVIPGFGFDVSLRNLVASEMAQMITETNANASFLCDADVDLWDTPTVFTPIAMRQLRRGSKRSTEPVL